jgi:cytochrome c553
MNALKLPTRFVFLCTAVGVILVLYAVARSQTAASSSKTVNSTLGAEIVNQGTTAGAIACVRCHGYDGASDGSGAFPALAGQSAEYQATQLHQFASGERQNAIMNLVAKGLNQDEIQAVSLYYANANPPVIARHAKSPDLVARGKQLALIGDASARVQNCISCHGPNGRGQPPSVPYLAGQYQAYIVLQLQMFQKGYRKSISMQGVAHNLPAEHAEAIAAYFEQLPLPSKPNSSAK